MSLNLTSVSNYLTERQALIAAREGFFQAIRVHLRPEQRIDADVLGDSHARAKARIITQDEWIANPARGYVTILEAPEKGRNFRFCILQLGNTLKVGIRLNQAMATQMAQQPRIASVVHETRPVLVFLSGLPNLAMLDWSFDAKNLYNSVQDYEEGIAKISAIFEAALQSTLNNF